MLQVLVGPADDAMTEHPETTQGTVSISMHRGIPGASETEPDHQTRPQNRTTKLVSSVCRCGEFASDWVLSPEIAIQAGLDHTRQVRQARDSGGPP